MVRLPHGAEAAEQLGYDPGVRVWDTNGLWAFRRLRELTARELLTRMARTGIDSDSPCVKGSDLTGSPGESSARELGVLTAKGTDVRCVDVSLV